MEGKKALFGKLVGTKWGRVKNTFGLDNPQFKHPDENKVVQAFLASGPLGILQIAENGSLREFQQILNSDPSKLSVRDSKGSTTAHHAVINDNVGILKFILETGGNSQLEEVDKDGNTPLHIATNSESPACIDFLLKNGASTRVMNNKSQSPLHLAAENGRSESLKAMAKHLQLFDVHLPGERGRTPLHLACILNRPECVQILTEDFCASYERGCAHSFLPIHEAVKHVSEKALESLLNSGEKIGCPREKMINLPDNDGNLALHFAVQSGDSNMVRICLESGSKISKARRDLCTALHLACAQGSVEIVKLMFQLQPEEQDESLRACDLEQMTPLHYAAMFGHTELTHFLAEQGSNLNSLDKTKCTPLHLAASKNAWKTAKFLITVGADVKIQDKNGWTPLHTIVKYNGDLDKIVDPEIAMSLVPVLNIQDRNGNTALHIATVQGQIKSTSILLALGANVTVKNINGDNVLHDACRFGRTKIIKMLSEHFKYSLVLNESNRNGWYPLHVAANEGHIKVVEELMADGALLRKDYEDRTPLHLAAANGHKEVVNLILSSHSHLMDSLDKLGNTPLHSAATNNQPKVVELLLRRGSLLTYNKDGNSAMDLALVNKFLEVAYVMAAHKTRADEVLSLTGGKHECIMEALIAQMPAVAKAVLDAGIKKSTIENLDSPNYHVEYNFKWLSKPGSQNSGDLYLPILNAMVNHERSSLLSHELSLKYLQMKWDTYGKYFQFASLLFYIIYLCMVTTIATSDVIKDFGFFIRSHWFNQEKNSTEKEAGGDEDESEFIDLSSYDYQTKWDIYNTYLSDNHLETELLVLPVICHMVAIATVIHLLIEVTSIFRHGIKCLENIDDWVWIVMNICVLIANYFQIYAYYVPGGGFWELVTPSMAIACFMGWYYALLLLQRFDTVGLYVSMFLEILKTLLRVLVVFSVLIIAFALTFYVLLANGNHTAFSTIPMAILQTLMMVMGETDFTGTFLHPYVCEEMDRNNLTDTRLYGTVEECEYPRRILHSYTTFTVVIIFMVFMPIVMLNLLLGLAVGDIELVRKNAVLKRLSMQVSNYTNVEKSLPKFFLAKLAKSTIIEYPNTSKTSIITEIAKVFQDEVKKDDEEDLGLQSDDMVDVIQDNNSNLGKLTSDMESMKSMMQLICQKMNILSDINIDDGVPAEDIKSIPDMQIGSSYSNNAPKIRRKPKLHWSFSNESNA